MGSTENAGFLLRGAGVPFFFVNESYEQLMAAGRWVVEPTVSMNPYEQGGGKWQIAMTQ